MKKRFLICLVALSVLCGCGKDARVQEGGADNNTPAMGGSLTVGITQDLDSLDPHVAVAAGTDEVLFNIFEGLVKPDEKGNMIPAVAESYSVSEDAKTYTFKLRDNVKFHNGDVVTTEDVVYSLRRCAGFADALDPNVLVESALSIVTDIYAPDNKTVVLTLSEANTELIYYLNGAIIPKNYKDQATAPIGTGPFKFVSYAPLQSFVIEKNNDYYGTKPYLDKVTFKIFANVDAAFMELLAGSVDIMTQLQADQTKQLESKYNIVGSNYNLVQALFLNNDFEPFRNADVRRALCYAVDRDEINRMISEGQGSLIGSGMFPGLATFFASDLVDHYSYDPEKAKALLASAGYSDLSFTIRIPSAYDSHVATGQIIVEQLKKVGVTAKIETIEWSAWLSDVYRNREFEATIIGLDANLAPSDILKRYRTTASNNFINYKNPDFDVAYRSGLTALDTESKVKYYHKCQELLTNDAASVFIQDPAQLTAVKKGLAGYTPYPVYVFDASKIYYTK